MATILGWLAGQRDHRTVRDLYDIQRAEGGEREADLVSFLSVQALCCDGMYAMSETVIASFDVDRELLGRWARDRTFPLLAFESCRVPAIPRATDASTQRDLASLPGRTHNSGGCHAGAVPHSGNENPSRLERFRGGHCPLLGADHDLGGRAGSSVPRTNALPDQLARGSAQFAHDEPQPSGAESKITGLRQKTAFSP